MFRINAILAVKVSSVLVVRYGYALPLVVGQAPVAASAAARHHQPFLTVPRSNKSNLIEPRVFLLLTVINSD